MPQNFITQHGLKVQLNLSFFMDLIDGEEKKYTSRELENNPVVSNMIFAAEQRWQIPCMLKWYFTIIALFLFSKNEFLIYCFVVFALYLLGITLRCKVSGIIINLVLNLLQTLFAFVSSIWIIPYLIIIVLSILLSNYIIMIAFFAASTILYILDNTVIAQFVMRRSLKKYGIAFHDTELASFVTFYILLNRKEGINNFIHSYCKYISNSKDKHINNN